MNANELADSLYNIESILDLVPLRDDAATMLRQQQAEIEALKAKLKLNDETLKPMLIEHIKSSTQRTQQEVFFSKYDSVRKAGEK